MGNICQGTKPQLPVILVNKEIGKARPLYRIESLPLLGGPDNILCFYAGYLFKGSIPADHMVVLVYQKLGDRRDLDYPAHSLENLS